MRPDHHDGGDAGCHIVATGTPEEIARVEASPTAQYLRQYLARRLPRRRRVG
jgi:excinuclease ABC subunit A